MDLTQGRQLAVMLPLVADFLPHLHAQVPILAFYEYIFEGTHEVKDRTFTSIVSAPNGTDQLEHTMDTSVELKMNPSFPQEKAQSCLQTASPLASASIKLPTILHKIFDLISALFEGVDENSPLWSEFGVVSCALRLLIETCQDSRLSALLVLASYHDRG